ncbi:RNase adapter RapZ [Streptosporangium sp. NPDC049644]|uniref:RapZ C-terminal domain-containing protein n=1 Tax=Streptosporangium sp. NPDC049644 TaxID=3155507 RepID=UPI003428F2C5
MADGGTVTITSFGYGHSPAPEADLTIDARRNLRNPHHNPAMRQLTGLDLSVRTHVLNTPGARTLIRHTAACILALLAGTGQDVTLATGCTGDWHRSVARATGRHTVREHIPCVASGCVVTIASSCVEPGLAGSPMPDPSGEPRIPRGEAELGAEGDGAFAADLPDVPPIQAHSPAAPSRTRRRSRRRTFDTAPARRSHALPRRRARHPNPVVVHMPRHRRRREERRGRQGRRDQ